MLYMATISFSGIISMSKGEIREITDSSLVEDLTKAGHIIEYKATKKADVTDKKTTKRKGTKNED